MAFTTALNVALTPATTSLSTVSAGASVEKNVASGLRAFPCRTQFAGDSLRLSPPKRQVARQMSYGNVAEADQDYYVREWPEPRFIEEVKGKFPEKAIATVEEARVLFSELGYTLLDVRSALEGDEVGKIKGAVNVPMAFCKRVYSKEQNKKVIQKEMNKNFLADMEKKIKNKDTKLLVMCSNGKQYSIDALTQLDEAGYTCLVGLQGGYRAWNRVFDNKLGRRRSGEYTEDWRHEADSCGIHASGAGFEKMDRIEQYAPLETY